MLVRFARGQRWTAIAALALDGQPGGFTADGVLVLREVLANFRAFASTQGELGKQLIAQYYERAEREIDRIAALIPEDSRGG